MVTLKEVLQQDADVLEHIHVYEHMYLHACLEVHHCFFYKVVLQSLSLLEISFNAGKNLGNPLWTRSGEQGDKWISATLFLTPQGLSPLQNQTTIVQV